MNNIKSEFEEAKNNISYKFQEIKYSAEYLDLKSNLNELGHHTKQIVTEDISQAGKSIGKLVKKFLSNDKFTQLISEKK